MQEVHTFRRLGVPPCWVRTVWMSGFQRRRVRRCEWETLLPNPGPLPQTSQTEATVTPFKRSGSRTSPHAKGLPTEKGRVNRSATGRRQPWKSTRRTRTDAESLRGPAFVQRRAVVRATALSPAGASDPPCGHGENAMNFVEYT